MLDDRSQQPKPQASAAHRSAQGTGGGETADARRGELQDAGCVELRTDAELSALAYRVLDPRRNHPIVCLTTRLGDAAPALSPSAVRAIVGAKVPIYIVSTGPPSRRLSALLPAGLDVWNGAARIWWPGLSDGGDPAEHPRIYDPTGRYGKDSLEQLAASFRARRAEAAVERRLAVAERERAKLQRRVRRLETELDAAHREPPRLSTDAGRPAKPLQPTAFAQLVEERDAKRDDGADEAEEGDAVRDAGQPSLAADDLQGELHRLIWSEWIALTSLEEREERPPRRFLLDRSLIDDIEQRRVDVPLKRVAWVCAAIIGDRAGELTGLDAHRYRGHRRSVRSDGAKLWRASLKRGAGGARLHYWTHPDGTIEFAQIGYHSLTPVTSHRSS
jgi:hypothetical protein